MNLSKKERDEYILNNMGLVGTIVNKALNILYIKKSIGSFDDAIQFGVISLCKAVDTYDPSKGFAFGTYAGRIIWNDLMSAAGKCALVRSPRHAMESKKDELKKKAESALNIDSIGIREMQAPCTRTTSPVDIAIQKETINKIRDAFQICDRNHRFILRHMFGFGTRTQINLTQIAGLMKISKQRVWLLAKEAKEIMRQETSSYYNLEFCDG
jgi:RNA polymerase sigma factor (sigma-70 family)